MSVLCASQLLFNCIFVQKIQKIMFSRKQTDCVCDVKDKQVCFLNLLPSFWYLPKAASVTLYNAMLCYLLIASVNQSVTQRTITIAKQQIMPRLCVAARHVGRVGAILCKRYIHLVTLPSLRKADYERKGREAGEGKR